MKRHLRPDPYLVTALAEAFTPAKIQAAADRRAAIEDDKRVYFLRDTESGRIKIGVSSNPRQRHAHISSQSGRRHDLLLTLPGGRPMEREMHRRFAAMRLLGEWFRPDAELVAFVAENSPRGAV